MLLGHGAAVFMRPQHGRIAGSVSSAAALSVLALRIAGPVSSAAALSAQDTYLADEWRDS